MKKLLLNLGFSMFLFFSGGNYVHAQEFSEHRKKVERRLSDYEQVLVKLANDIDIYIVTSRNGHHVNLLAKRTGVKPIMPNNKYSCYRIAFHSNNLELKQMAERLDKDKNKIIDLDELGEIY